MAWKNSAGVKLNDATELIIRADPDGTVESCYNLSNDTEYVHAPATPWDWKGENPELVKEYAKVRIYLKDTNWTSWTPSTTASDMTNEISLDTLDADYANYDYIGLGYYKSHLVYSVPKAANYSDFSMGIRHNVLAGSPLTYADFENESAITPLAMNAENYTETHYINSALANVLIDGGYGVFMTTSGPIISSGTNVINIKQPKIQARCQNTYFSTTAAGNIDADNSYIDVKIIVYKVKKQTTNFGALRSKTMLELFKNGVPD